MNLHDLITRTRTGAAWGFFSRLQAGKAHIYTGVPINDLDQAPRWIRRAAEYPWTNFVAVCGARNANVTAIGLWQYSNGLYDPCTRCSEARPNFANPTRAGSIDTPLQLENFVAQ